LPVKSNRPGEGGVGCYWFQAACHFSAAGILEFFFLPFFRDVSISFFLTHDKNVVKEKAVW